MFERFTDRARRVVVLAQEESRLLGHNYIGTEHILLGIVHEGEGVAAKALEVMKISLESVRHQVEEIIGRGSGAVQGHIPFTPRAKKVLELSLREALQLGHNYIGTEHILLGLIREGEGVGAQVLLKLGADLGGVRGVVIDLLAGREPTVEAVPPRPRFQRSFAPRILPNTPTCSFCGRDLWEVDHYVAGIGAVMCDGCVEAATAALREPSAREVSLPPRLFGSDITPEDASDIYYAFATVFETGESVDRAPFLEDGDAIFAFLGNIATQLPDVEVRNVIIYGVRSAGPDTADVRFALHIGPNPAGHPFVGRAVRSGGRWLVTRDTFGAMLARGGITLPPPDEPGPATNSPGAPSPPAP
jgi:Clp amino terminal domain, pathogenicity island component/ClpX C4-type zinc finger